jgi:glucan-binding YG repeat protein
MKKRIISLLLAVVMVLTILPHLTTEAKAHQIVMTAEEFIDCLWTAYNRPNVYKNVYPYNLGYYDGSVIYFDCWNLGKAIIWSKGAIVNNYTVGYHASMDTSCGLGDWDGLTIVKEAPNCSTDFSNLVPGEWLYMENHTGYYVGNGQVIECTTGWNVWGITISQIDSYGNRSRNGVYRGKWEYHGMVPWLDYSADRDHWEQDSTGWWYEYADGSYAIGWTKIDGNWYYFSANGYMYTGWLFDEKYQGWYFLDPTSGVMQTGWVYSGGYYYYMDSSGKMLEGWQKINEDWYYLNTTDQWPQGAMFTGWHEIDGQQYYFSEADYSSLGKMVTGWFHDGYHWYYFGQDGAMLYGWQKVDGAWYHLDETTGIMSTYAWVLDEGVWYYVNGSGAMTEGAQWNGTYEDALDIGTDFYATIDIPATGTRAGIDSDENSDTYRNLEVQAVRAEDAADFEEQLWYFQRREDGSYRIINVATELCLDVIGGYVDAGTNVRVWSGNDTIAQRWFFYQDGDNYGIVAACNVWDKTVLDVVDGMADEGTNIRIWGYNGSGAQQFKITPVGCHTEHDYTYEVTDAPTADADGVLTGTCSGCSETTTVALPKLNTADYTYTIEQAPTATASGIGRYTWNTDDYGTFYFDVELEPTGTIEFMLGDVDQNGQIDTTDFMRVKAAYVGAYELNEIEFLAADVDRNGVIDTTDFMRIKAHFLGTYVIE